MTTRSFFPFFLSSNRVKFHGKPPPSLLEHPPSGHPEWTSLNLLFLFSLRASASKLSHSRPFFRGGQLMRVPIASPFSFPPNRCGGKGSFHVIPGNRNPSLFHPLSFFFRQRGEPYVLFPPPNSSFFSFIGLQGGSKIRRAPSFFMRPRHHRLPLPFFPAAPAPPVSGV